MRSCARALVFHETDRRTTIAAVRAEINGTSLSPLRRYLTPTAVPSFETKRLPASRDVTAPDGSDVRLLLGLGRGSMAHFELGPGQTSTAVTHRTVDEIWFFLSGRGEMWRMDGEAETVVPVEPGVCLTIPQGTHFQFRSFGGEPLAAVGVTMPPWPGDDEALVVRGKWVPTVR
jgi:mannose-6-phosphate isomerase-like protein (cupin superfamily)